MFNWKENFVELSIDILLLLEEKHIEYLMEREKEELKNLALVLRDRPYIAWYFKNKCKASESWVEDLVDSFKNEPIPDDMKDIEIDTLYSMEDWIIYLTTPEDYHKQDFNGWDERELTDLTDFEGKRVIDIGSGTGKQAFAVAHLAKTLYCVEPVENLRKFLRNRASEEKCSNLYVVDGLLEKVPFEDGIADVAMCGHVFGDKVEVELKELERITKKGGMVILCPGNNDKDNSTHHFLVSNGYLWSRFLEPGDKPWCGYKRKYWKVKY